MNELTEDRNRSAVFQPDHERQTSSSGYQRCMLLEVFASPEEVNS
jgi:hypothetical protein